MKRLLIGSCGGLSGFYLAKIFRSSYKNGIDLWGLDASTSFATDQFLDKFFVSPKASSREEFVDFLIRFFNTNSIDYYLPTNSIEVIIVSEYEYEIRARCDTKFIISPFETYKALNNKRDVLNRLVE